MNRRILAVVLIMLTLVFALSVGCVPQNQIKTGAFNSLVQMNEAGIKGIDSEIVRIDQSIYDAKVRLLKLEQVAKPALKWVEYQKTKEYQTGSVWNVRIAEEGLAKLRNDRYRITTLELEALRTSGNGWQFSSTVKVTDVTTNETSDLGAVSAELKSLIASLEKQRQAKLASRASSISTMKSIVAYVDNWKVEKSNQNTYQLSGPGLGWAERITEGRWTYQVDSKEMVPVDNQGTALKNILSATL